MNSFHALYEVLTSIDHKKIASESIEETSEQLSDANRKQLREGFDRTGKRLRKYRSPKYARAKYGMNPLPGLGNPDLKLTGKFHREIKTSVTGETIVTASTDGKALMLEKSYGPNIYGPGGNYKNEYINEDLRPVWQNKIEMLTGLRFR